MLSKLLRGAAALPAVRLNWSSPGAQGGAPEGDSGAAQRQIDTLKEQMERRVRDARQAGYGEGHTAGRAQAAAELQPVIEKASHAILEIAGLRPPAAGSAG